MSAPAVQDQVLDLITRHAELPVAYRMWVTDSARRAGLPDLRSDAELGVGEVLSWDGLIFRCERELRYRAAEAR